MDGTGDHGPGLTRKASGPSWAPPGRGAGLDSDGRQPRPGGSGRADHPPQRCAGAAARGPGGTRASGQPDQAWEGCDKGYNLAAFARTGKGGPPAGRRCAVFSERRRRRRGAGDWTGPAGAGRDRPSQPDRSSAS